MVDCPERSRFSGWKLVRVGVEQRQLTIGSSATGNTKPVLDLYILDSYEKYIGPKYSNYVAQAAVLNSFDDNPSSTYPRLLISLKKPHIILSYGCRPRRASSYARHLSY